MTNFILKNRIAMIACLCLLFSASIARAQTQSISYQGKLTDNGAPANGVYDFVFKLFNQNGVQFSFDVPVSDVQVTNGIFNVLIPFEETPGIFLIGSRKFLEIAVRPGASTGAYTTLAPRQEFGSVPSAVYARNANESFGAEFARGLNIAGLIIPANQFVQTNDSRLSDARNPLAGSANYIQNSTTLQSTSNFYISGTGRANIFNANRYDLSGQSILTSLETNLSLGFQSGDVTGGTYNTYVGTGAGKLAQATGFDNSFFGYESGLTNDFGDYNSFFGSRSGRSNTSGGGNVFSGYHSGSNNTTGDSNTFVGATTGLSNTTGSNNTVLGNQADVSAAISNATALGFQAKVTSSNSLILGSIAGVNNATADTRVGIGTTAPADKLHVNGGNVRVTNGGIFIANPNTLVITSPNGACWGITVNNSGQLSTFSTACP